MKHLLVSLRIMFFFTLLCGLIYPLAMTGFAQAFFNEKANGSLVYKGEKVVGSLLIAQSFEKPEYFWPRPSAVSFNPLPSGGSNQGQAAEALKTVVAERRAKLKQSHSQSAEPPQDLLFASASGLDPHISFEAALYQAQRVSVARSLPVQAVIDLITEHREARQFGILGEATVNVLALNLSLDKM